MRIQKNKSRINKIMKNEKIREQSKNNKNPETLAAVHTHTHTHKRFRE